MIVGIIVIVAIVLLVVGPWPEWDMGDQGSFRQQTEYRIARLTIPTAKKSQLLAGTSKVDITPESKDFALAGYIARYGEPNQGIAGRCYARGLTLRSGDITVTILTCDLTLITPALRDAILQRTQLPREAIYFTASHTHSGPGGYGSNLLEDMALGQRDPAYFNWLADQLCEAVIQSRQSLTPVSIAAVSQDASYHIWNRLDHDLPTDSDLHALLLRDERDKPARPYLAILGIFAAHATAATPANHQLSPDYPGGFYEYAHELKWTDHPMFASGAVGDASPNWEPRPTETARAHMMGRHIGSILLRYFQSEKQPDWQERVVLRSVVVPIDLSHPRVSYKRGWRLSPLATSLAIQKRQTELHVLQIGSIYLVGFPSDVGGGIALDLREWGNKQGMTILCTSFNSDYIGYIVDGNRAVQHDTYETTLMNFFGQRSGDYLREMTKRIIAQLPESQQSD